MEKKTYTARIPIECSKRLYIALESSRAPEEWPRAPDTERCICHRRVVRVSQAKLITRQSTVVANRRATAVEGGTIALESGICREPGAGKAGSAPL